MRSFFEAISNQWKFALSYDAALSMAAAMQLILDGDIRFDPEFFAVTNAPEPSLKTGFAEAQPAPTSGTGTVAIIPLHGMLMMADQPCGPKGMVTMGRWIQEADDNPDVDAILLDIYSPGGQVNGTETLGNIIKGTKKPIVAWPNSLTASAAYWLAAHADKVIAAGKTTHIGSIGIMMSYLDMSRYMEKKGITRVDIRSSLSPEKNKFNLDQPSEEDIKLIQSEMLDPLAEIFHETVRTHRPGISEDVMSGNVYLAEQAIEMGLIDGIGSLEYAIQVALQMASDSPKSKPKINVTMEEPNMDVQALKASIEEKDLAFQALKAKLKIQEDLNAAQAKEILELKAENERLGNQTESEETKETAPKGKSPLAGVDPKFVTEVDRLLHAHLANK